MTGILKKQPEKTDRCEPAENFRVSPVWFPQAKIEHDDFI